ncbi:SpoIIE family protein phosphatase, partial [Streptomyces noursei]
MVFRRLAHLRRRPDPSHALLLIPIGLIVAVCSADALSPPDVHLRPLLVAAPALGAAVAGPVPTALIGGLTLAADLIVAALQGVLFTHPLPPHHTALPIGLGALTGPPNYPTDTFPFHPGDLLLLYTDGVT